MAGFARIPVIDQSVPAAGVPNRPRPALLDTEKPTSPIGSALSAAGESGEAVARVAQIQAYHKNLLDSFSAEADYKDRANSIYNTAKQLPGDQWAPTVTKQLADLSQKMLSDPNNANIAPFLQKRIPALQTMFIDDARTAGMVQTAHEQDDQLKAFSGKLGAQAGASYTVNPDGSIADGAATGPARAQAFGLIDQMSGKNPTVNAFHKQLFEDSLIQQRAQAIARNSPGNVLDSYLNANPGKFTPEQEGSLKTISTAAMNAPIKQWDANQAQARADALSYQKQQIQQTGHPDMTRLAHDTQFRILKDDDFTGFTGMQYERPTPQPTKDLYKSRIENAASTDDLDAIKGDLHAAGANKEMNGGDVQEFLTQVAARDKEIKTPAGQANIKALSALQAAYYPADTRTPEGRADRMAQLRNPGVFERAYKQAEAVYKAETFGKPSDPNAYTDAMQKALKAFPRPGSGGPAPAAPAGPVPGLSPADAAKILAAAKAGGLIH